LRKAKQITISLQNRKDAALESLIAKMDKTVTIVGLAKVVATGCRM
jgi:hypothetical protein